MNRFLDPLFFFFSYRSLVDQYDACSFGDPLFSNYLLVPLQQIYDVGLRKHVWIEHSTILKYLRLKPDQVSSSHFHAEIRIEFPSFQLLYGLENFFVPLETDLEMIRYYSQILLNETLKRSTQPLLYMIATHHLNAFLFDQTRPEQFNLQKTIFKNLKMSLNKDEVCLMRCPCQLSFRAVPRTLDFI